jgi:hypothetical protein
MYPIGSGVNYMDGEKENNTERKQYVKPEVTHELELETRAGSPTTSDPNPLDPMP